MAAAAPSESASPGRSLSAASSIRQIGETIHKNVASAVGLALASLAARKRLASSMHRAELLGAGALAIEGNIGFYGKSGFEVAGTRGIRYAAEPPDAEVPYFLIRELKPGFLTGVTGTYQDPEGYFVDEAEAERFDAQFPPKEKQKLPGQLF